MLIVALAVLAGATIALAFFLIVIDVAIRAVGWRPPAYTSAVVEYILLYYTLLAAPYLVRQKAHVYIDALVSHLSPRPRWLLEKIVYAICIATSLVFAIIGLQLSIEAFESGLFDERSIDIPTWLLYVPMAIAFPLVAIEFGRYLIGLDSMYLDRTEVVDNL